MNKFFREGERKRVTIVIKRQTGKMSTSVQLDQVYYNIITYILFLLDISKYINIYIHGQLIFPVRNFDLNIKQSSIYKK
jgi:hypothetical protein